MNNVIINNSRINIQIQNINKMETNSSIAQKLNRIGFKQTEVSVFKNGVILAQLVNLMFYNNKNQTFMNKFSQRNQDKKGQQVVNVSLVLKQLKSDNSINIPGNIRAMTAFDLIQKQQKMLAFLSWIFSENQKNNSPNSPKFEENERALDNLYFASNLIKQKQDQQVYQMNDSLNSSADKVVKKGSFKLLRPKTDLESENVRANKQKQNSPDKQYQKLNLKIQEKTQRQPSERKTIPKMSEKPPLYKQANKQNTKKILSSQTSNFISPATKSPATNPFNEEYQSNSTTKRQNQNVEIPKQQIKQKGSQNYQSKKNSRKSIFKLNFEEVTEDDRKSIVQWLIGINLLNSLAVKHYQNLHQICKNGVIFPEIINYLKGRGCEICYFKDPKRSAEMNSNYQKVFNYLSQNPSFHSELIFLYEYFIPEVQEKAFWSFIKSIYITFSKSRKSKNPTTEDYDSTILRKLNSLASVKSSANKSGSIDTQFYKQIKYGSNIKEPKDLVKSKSYQKVQFVKELPQTNNIKEKLIQNIEPEESSMINRGYKQLHERKTLRKYDTPKKSSILNTSMSRSRILSMGSIRKSSQKRQIEVPTINMDMQMKAQQFLRNHQYQWLYSREGRQLFEDPVRNGCLVNQIIRKFLKITVSYHQVVKSINDCRDNYKLAFEAIKRKITEFHPGYNFHKQEIIKGDFSLFYGIIYNIQQYVNQETYDRPQNTKTHSNLHNAYCTNNIIKPSKNNGLSNSKIHKNLKPMIS